eukprot:354172-Chlamydomonas_euryale.AAC.1
MRPANLRKSGNVVVSPREPSSWHARTSRTHPHLPCRPLISVISVISVISQDPDAGGGRNRPSLSVSRRLPSSPSPTPTGPRIARAGARGLARPPIPALAQS